MSRLRDLFEELCERGSVHSGKVEERGQLRGRRLWNGRRAVAIPRMVSSHRLRLSANPLQEGAIGAPLW
jgi:hypothetical protein